MTRKCEKCGDEIPSRARKRFCIPCANRNNYLYSVKAKKPKKRELITPLWKWMPKYLHEWNQDLMDGRKEERKRKWRIRFRRRNKSVEYP